MRLGLGWVGDGDGDKCGDGDGARDGDRDERMLWKRIGMPVTSKRIRM